MKETSRSAVVSQAWLVGGVEGVRMQQKELALAAEAAFRVCARQASTDVERYALVDRANEVRPVTWV